MKESAVFKNGYHESNVSPKGTQTGENMMQPMNKESGPNIQWVAECQGFNWNF